MTPRGRIRSLILGLLLCCPVSLAAKSPLPIVEGNVTRVIDGDTLDVLLSSGRIRVRLQGIDAPERDQRGGREATDWLAAQLKDPHVELEPVSQDQYGRMVAIVHRGNLDLNRELVKQGHAFAYRRYLRREDRSLCHVEHEARRAGRGLWQRERAPANAPWQHRATRGKGPFTDFSRSSARDCLRAAGRKPRS